MIHINLLPKTQRPVTRWQRPQVNPRQAIIGGVAVVGLVTVTLVFWARGLERSLAQMEQEWQTLKESRAEVENYRDNVERLERQAQRFAHLRTAGVQWAPRLNLLADAIVPGLWFSRLTVEPMEATAAPKPSRKKEGKEKAPGGAAKSKPPAPAAGKTLRMTLTGTALVPPPDQPSPLGALIQSLKRHPEFARLFKQVEIKSVERRRLGTYDVTDFVLLLDVEDPLTS